MWSAFSLEQGGIPEERFYEAFGFGDSPALADELGQLVLSGIKRATAGSVWSYESSGKGVPKPGDLSVVTDSNDIPLCIIETVQVDIVPFSAVTEEFAATEGEGGWLSGLLASSACRVLQQRMRKHRSLV
ncbi:ASCH domain-containing protein [Comamonas koreensis]|uniref:ASCH domain-containing protein n=2 Tax=Comamonas koreensis TaxID=160825 RepID=A0AAW4XTX0_9BURK|nr:ASCH domain-containing protein [Comamonas koreensis]